jgi:hypothetical protein
MLYTLQYQMYKYEHGLCAAEQRAADVRAGEAAIALRDARLRLRRSFRLRPARWTEDVVTRSWASAPARVPSNVR